MIYEYSCENSHCKSFNVLQEITKYISDIDREEKCEACNGVMKRIFSTNIAINFGNISGGYNYQERSMGLGKKDKYIEVKGEQTVSYAYRCLNNKCKVFDDIVTVDKKMTEVDRIEPCDKCKQPMGRVFSCSYRWGKGSRPDTDSRREAMAKALDNNDYAKVEDLQLNYDSTGRSYFCDDKKEKKKYKVINSDIQREFEYVCDNAKCEDFEKTIYVKKSISKSDKIEKCKKCKEKLRRVFGMGGFSFKEK